MGLFGWLTFPLKLLDKHSIKVIFNIVIDWALLWLEPRLLFCKVVTEFPLSWDLTAEEIASLLFRVEVHPLRVLILVFIVLPKLLTAIILRVLLLPRLLGPCIGFLHLTLMLAAKLLEGMIRLLLSRLNILRLLAVDCFSLIRL